MYMLLNYQKNYVYFLKKRQNSLLNLHTFKVKDGEFNHYYSSKCWKWVERCVVLASVTHQFYNKSVYKL